ncbi:hypothetical protein E4T52_13557 [Aureobasidium sp. EXF-3400]|nr:hypothetical protein E4T51_12596 [Aureobasidium sp. EXF-12344]KAI4771444.1 hypothetical protein E4T52_13557 [Aureobasidium sp. EXF-3400]
MASNGLTATPLGQQGGFNWLFLVDLIVCGILALFFIFYFNRTVSTIVSYAIRAWTWHKYRAYIDITSFQLSLLGGRLFFKSIRYHGHNQTVFVHDGNITWRYWLRQVQEPLIMQKVSQRHDDSDSNQSPSDASNEKARPRSKSVGRAEAADTNRPRNLPCRILVKVKGVEAFLYNQSPVYDNIIANLQNQARTKDPNVPSADIPAQNSSKETVPPDVLDRQQTATSVDGSVLAETASRTTTRTATHETAIPAFLRMFPIQVECKKAAAAVGNDFTQSILTAKLENASGRIDADEAGSLDLYKLMFDFDFHDINVALKPNTDYRMSQMQAAARLDKDEDPKAKKGRGIFGLHPIRRAGKILQSLLHAIVWLFTWRRSSKRSVRTASLLSEDESLGEESAKLPGAAQWQGLARYLDETSNEHNEWDNVEYARFSNIADVKKASMNFYWDVPGTVSKSDFAGQTSFSDELNGPSAPEYGLNLSVDGAVINYGPWADRQRITLQNVFFPASYHDAVPAQRLTVDQNRVATVFKLFFCLESEITLRIPTREASKDWKWQGRAEGHKAQKTSETGVRKRRGKGTKKWFKKEQQSTGADIRPFGWLDVKVAADTTINYAMDMYARHDGFHNTLSLDVKGTEISSSVNHAMLWKAGNLLLEGDLSNPLKWNALRKWLFKIHCDGLDLYILRDHLFLLTDLIADWGMGPPPDFYTFVPFMYSLDINFKNFKLFLNANDANIVNDPSDLEDNNFLILGGEELHATLEIPIDQYRPAQNSIKFDVLAKDLSLDISNPPRITLHSLLRQKRLGTLKKLTLGGSHTLFVEQAPGLVDMLQMDICGTDLELQAFGYLVRMFINVKENYFGEFLHFKTLEEYQNAGADAANAETNMVGRFAFRPANDLDVVLCITAEHPIIMLPANLYSAETYIRLELPVASMDLRVANYYLDLAVDVSPVSVSWSGIPNDEDGFDDSSPQIMLESASVTGHRLFGLPPTEPAYVSNWDVTLGNVSGEFTLDFIQHLAKAGRAVAFALDDFENALPLAQTAEIPEAVFLRLKTGSICLWLNEGKSAIRLYSEPVTLNQNDRADGLFSSRLHLHIPNITATCVDSNSIAHRGSRGDVQPAKCIAFVQTSLDMSMVQRKAHFNAEREKQQTHMRQQDVRTGRAKFLIAQNGSGADQDGADHEEEENLPDPPSMALPKLPDPLRKGPLKMGLAADGSIKSSLHSGSSVNRTSTRKALPKGDLDDVGHSRPAMYYANSAASQPLGTMGLWSPFSVPDPHNLDIAADLSKVPQFSTVVDEADDISESSSQSDLSINLDQDGDLDQQTFMIRMVPGIRIYVEPRISETIVNIVTALQPKRSEDVIDTFQMDVMGKVQQVQDQKKSRRGIVELNLIVPSIDARLFNDQKLDTSRITAVPVQDQLDVGLSHLSLTLRFKPIPDTESGTALTMHLTLESALAKFSNPLEKSKTSDYAIRLGFDDVLIWMILSKSKSVHVSFQDLLGVVSGSQADYLASVFSRYAAIGAKIQKQADAVEIGSKARLRNLTDYLTEHADVSTDPPYLSRMTYVLRAFPDHFRNQESWKIVARFRHIYECLSDESHVDLEQQLADGIDTLKKTSSILETWAAWCSWDIPNVEQTQVFKLLLGDVEAKIPEEDIEPLDLTLRAGVVRIAVESGKASSEISLGSLSIGVTVIPPSLPSGLMLVEENLRSKTVFQAHTAASVLRLNWDILEQVDAFIDIYFEQVSHTLDALPDPPEKEALEDLTFRQDFHVVLSTDEGSIELNTINLRHVSTCNNLKLSLIGSDKASQDYGECISLLISARKAFTELHSAEQRIWRTDLGSPSIYIDVKQTIREFTTAINVGGSYEQLHISLEQEALGLLEVVDRLLVDEVAYIQRFQKHIQKEQKKSVATRGASKPERELKLNVAFLAGSFSLNVALLKALNLSVKGDTANLRVRPTSGASTAWSVELHLGTMEQALVRKEEGSKKQRAVFHTPPASSTLNLELTEKQINISFTGIMEEVMLEASAVQSVLSILNRPEVQGVLETIRDQVSDLRKRVEKTLAPDKKEVKPKTVDEESRLIVYDVNTALAGFKVVAIAPVLTAGKARAELTFGLGAVQAAVTNKTRKASDSFPDIRGKIQDIGAVLTLIEDGKRRPCGHVSVSVAVDCCTQEPATGPLTRDIKARSESFDVFVYADTASTVVDIVTHVHRKILDLDLSKEVEYLRRLRHSRAKRRKSIPPPAPDSIKEEEENAVVDVPSTRPALLDFSLDLRKIRIVWVVLRNRLGGDQEPQDLEVSFSRVHLAIQKLNEARLSIQDLQVQVVPKEHKAFERSENSALLPEVVFTVRYESGKDGVRIACQAAGQALDIRLDSGFVVPVSMLQKSISAAIDQYRAAKLNWQADATPDDNKTTPRASPFGDKRLASLQADVNFKGALFYIQGDAPNQVGAALRPAHVDLPYKRNRANSHASQDNIATSLRAPGIAIKIEYSNLPEKEQILNGEIKVDASSNTVYPELVPIVLQITHGVKEVVRYGEEERKTPSTPKIAQEQALKLQRLRGEDDSLLTSDPSQFLGQMKLNLGLRICKQEFGLSCQPLARVNAKSQIEDIYITMSTINSHQFGHFFALSATVTKLGASVQHVYSRESTFSFDMESISMSLMNSRHLTGGSSGVSMVLKVSPTRTALNVRQIQDLLLFREIWFPPELRDTSAMSPEPSYQEPDVLVVQRYQQVSAAAAFPWNATVAVAELAIDLDLGQSIGKSSLSIKNLWGSSKKSSTWKQDLCIGVDEVSVNSTGRMSGFVELSDVSVRTSIEWPSADRQEHKAPLIQAAIGFGRISAKTALDYQPFAFADIEAFNFLMYNVRDGPHAPDRLKAILEGEKVYVFCTATSPAQAVGLYQALDRLIQEKQTAYSQSMVDLDTQLRRRSVSKARRKSEPSPPIPIRRHTTERSKSKFPITLDTDVMVMLKSVCFGAFPSTFFDNQILKMEASEIQARFAVGVEDERVHSNLSMTLGQLQVALAQVKRVSVPKTLGDISIEEVIGSATGAKGGIILRVPKVIASMQTWQKPNDNNIDYIFKSLFEGKVDVGWNYSRISFIRGMWETHSRSLASRLGKPLPESAVKITANGPPKPESSTSNADKLNGAAEQGKITAVVNVPQSRFEYTALEAPIIETPQLRDMGEATPPLEWIGLHRERLPNVTHQVVIVTLLEVAKEVEDAYERILGSGVR